MSVISETYHIITFIIYCSSKAWSVTLTMGIQQSCMCPGSLHYTAYTFAIQYASKAWSVACVLMFQNVFALWHLPRDSHVPIYYNLTFFVPPDARCILNMNRSGVLHILFRLLAIFRCCIIFSTFRLLCLEHLLHLFSPFIYFSSFTLSYMNGKHWGYKIHHRRLHQRFFSPLSLSSPFFPFLYPSFPRVPPLSS